MAATKIPTRAAHIGPSSAVCALAMKIDWTSARVVKLTARKDFTLKACTIDTRTGEEVDAFVPVKIYAGTVLYFAASDKAEGYYYLTRIIGETVSCSCPAHKDCKHQGRVLNYRNGVWQKTVKPAPAKPTVKQPVTAPKPEYPPIQRRSVAEWKQIQKRDTERQKAEKAAYMRKVKAAREADLAGVAS